MFYYNSTLNIWSDQLPADIAAATRKKFAAWGGEQQRYLANGWRIVTESTPVYNGSPLTGQRVRTLDAGGNTFSWMVGEVRWNNAIDTESQIETLRSTKIQQLHEWWDTHSGIEVVNGVVLPIQEAGRNTNASSLAIALLTQSETIDLVSVDDYTVTLPLADGLTALAVFRAAYDPVSQAWDDTHQALLAATTLQQLEAIEIPN